MYSSSTITKEVKISDEPASVSSSTNINGNAASPAARAVKALALYNFNPGQPDEIVLSKGDKLTVTERDPSGWWTGKNETTGAFGLFPGGFVRILEEKDKPEQGTTDDSRIFQLESDNKALQDEIAALKHKLEQQSQEHQRRIDEIKATVHEESKPREVDTSSQEKIADLELKLAEEICKRLESDNLAQNLQTQIEEMKKAPPTAPLGDSSLGAGLKDSERIEHLRNRVLELQAGFLADKKRFEDINARLQAEITELKKNSAPSPLLKTGSESNLHSTSAPVTLKIQDPWEKYNIDEINDIQKLKEVMKEIHVLYQQEMKYAQDMLDYSENSLTPIKRKLQAEISELKSLVDKAVKDKNAVEAAMRKMKAQEHKQQSTK